MNLREQIGRRIKGLREQRGWSQRDLGERANMTHSFLSRLERGQTGIEVETLSNLAQALGVGLSDLLTDEPAIAPASGAAPGLGQWEAVVQSLSAASRELAETLRLQVQEVSAPLARAQEIAQENVRQAFRWAEIQSPHVAHHDGGAVAQGER